MYNIINFNKYFCNYFFCLRICKNFGKSNIYFCNVYSKNFSLANHNKK